MSKVFGKFGKKNCHFLRFYTKNDIKTYFSQAIFGHFEKDTLNLGYKGHWNLAELVLTLILLTILTSFDPKPDPYFST